MPEYHQPKMEFPRPSVRRHSSAVYFTCLASAASKQNALPGRAPPERASECVLRLRVCLPDCWGIATVIPVPTYDYLGGGYPVPPSGDHRRDNLQGRHKNLENYNMRNPLSICNFFIYTRGTGALANAVGSEQNYLLPQTHLFRAVESYGSWG